MADWKNATPASAELDRPRPVLHRRLGGALEHLRLAPDPLLAPFLEHCWRVRWTCADSHRRHRRPCRIRTRIGCSSPASRASTASTAAAFVRVQEGRVVDWAELALSLGYFDQAHFIGDFARLVGQPPGEYACREGRG